MTGLNKVFRFCVRGNSSLNRTCAIGSTYTCGNPRCGLDGKREGSAVRRLVLIHHKRQVQLSTTLLCEGETNKTPAIASHKVNGLGGYGIGGHD